MRDKWVSLAKSVLQDAKSRKGRNRTNVDGMEHTLTSDDIKSVWNKQFGLCPLTQVKLRFISNSRSKAGDRKKNKNISIDRINSSLGYCLENIMVVCKMVQITKNALSVKQYIALCRRIADVADAVDYPKMSENEVDEMLDSF